MRQRVAADPKPAGTSWDPLRSRRYFLGGLAVGVIAMSATGLAAATLIESPQQVTAQSAAPSGTPITVPARWQALRNSIVVAGTVRSAMTFGVTAQAPLPVLVVTRMPVRPGDRVRPGRVIAEIDGRPVFLLRGRLPPYRNLREGDTGPDVEQLQDTLESLGYQIFDTQGTFGSSTSLALTLFYGHFGYRAPLYRPPNSASGPAAHAGSRPATGTQQVPSAYLPMSEVVYIPSPSALVTSVTARTGSTVQPGQQLIRLATGNPYVTATLTGSQARQVRAGVPALITSPSPALAATGEVTRIGPLPSGGGIGGPAAAFPVTVTTSRPLPQPLIGTQVRLTLYAPVTSGPVLSVPVTAIFGGNGGRSPYVVRVTGRGQVRVEVFTGPSGDGYVAVQPVVAGRLVPGDRVLVGYRS